MQYEAENFQDGTTSQKKADELEERLVKVRTAWLQHLQKTGADAEAQRLAEQWLPATMRDGALRTAVLALWTEQAKIALKNADYTKARVWFERGPGPGDEVFKPGRVWRHADLAIKRFQPEPLLRLGLRRSRAWRSADLHSALAPLPTPKPRLVLEDSNGGSLLVSDFVRGKFLSALWNAGGPGVHAFPHFMAAMHRRRSLHGDFHTYNALWNGREWVLLDLDGLRGPLHSLRRTSLILNHWGRIHLALRGARGLRDSFATYLEASKLAWDLERSWPKVVACSGSWAAMRGVDLGYLQRDGLDPAP